LEQEFLEDIVARLENTGVVYAVTGSVASNFWGIPRTTHDVDVVVVLVAADAARMTAAFADRYYVSEQAVKDAVSRLSMFNVIDFSLNLKADFWVTRDDPFNQSMLQRRRREEIVPGQLGWIGTPEDVLLHKLVWHTITPSERQLADAAGIAAVQAGSLDLDYLRMWALRQRTSSLLEEVLQGKYLKKT
jgi:hypothetical protein